MFSARTTSTFGGSFTPPPTFRPGSATKSFSPSPQRQEPVRLGQALAGGDAGAGVGLGFADLDQGVAVDVLERLVAPPDLQHRRGDVRPAAVVLEADVQLVGIRPERPLQE